MEVNDKVGEVEVAYKPKIKERRKLTDSAACYDFLIEKCYNPDTIEYREEFKVLFLNNSLQLLGWSTISSGGLTETTVDIRMLMQYSLLMNAKLIVCSHNHPSGSLKPSKDDERLTERIKKASELMSIKLLDHIIVTPEQYYSFNDEGKL